MATAGSVTRWIGRLRGGDVDAARQLWERYFRRLVGLARARLAAAPRRVSDEEDVALDALDSLCRGVASGRFPDLVDRDSVWRLLLTITCRKAGDQLQREGRQKRGGGRDVVPLGDLVDTAPSPEFAAAVADELRRLLDLLNDADLRTIALRKFEGHTNTEIAALLGRSLSSVERGLRLIRQVWQCEVSP